MNKQFIGDKRIQEIRPIENEKTSGGTSIEEVVFEDGSIEWFSSLMLKNIITDQKIDPTQLRDKRILPVVQMLLIILRDWGIKTGELPYLSALLNQLLNSNTEEATKELWARFMPKPRDLDEINLIAVDRVLKTISRSKDVK